MKTLIQLLGCLALCHSSLLAQEDEAGSFEDTVPAEAVSGTTSVLDEEVIPKAYPESRYQSTWSNNPFLLVTKVTENKRVDWSEDWALSSMFKSETGKISIGLQNKQTAEYKRVTSEDPAGSEFQFVSANFNRNRNEASVQISKGGITATIKYDDNLTSRPVTVNNTFAAPAAQPGAAPAARPGQPVNVIQPGAPGGGPGAVSPPRPGQAPGVSPQSPASPPSITRRRNLIPIPPAPTPAPAQTLPQQ